MKECLTCGGRYEPILADGMQYFHTCPPVRQLLDDTGAPIDAQTADGLLKLGAPVYERFDERPNKRDENIAEPTDRKGKPKVKAEGLGVRDVQRRPDPLDGAQQVPPRPLVP